MNRRSIFASAAIFLAFGCSSADGSSTDDGGTDPSDTKTTPVTDTGTTPGSDTGTSPGTDTGTTPPKDTGTTPPTDTGPSSDPYASARDTCLTEINKYRDTLGLAHYVGWSAESSCADGQSKSDSESGKAHGAFGACKESAQNECPGWPGPADTLITGCLKMMWAEGPGTDFSKHGHYINMSSTKYTAVACGFYKTPKGDYWAVQDFH